MLEEIYVNSFKNCTTEDFKKEDISQILENDLISMGDPDKKPDLETFRTYNEDIGKNFKKIHRNTALKNVSEVQFNGSNIGHKENLSQLEKDNPNLVLEDDYLEKLGETCQTTIGSSTEKPQTYSLDDIDTVSYTHLTLPTILLV